MVSDELWELVEPLIPARQPGRRGRTGRPRLSDRAVLAGVVFVLTTGISWNALPRELGCGSGVTCWRRLREMAADRSVGAAAPAGARPARAAWAAGLVPGGRWTASASEPRGRAS